MIVSCLGAQLRWLNQLGHFTPLSPTMAGNQSNSNNTTFHGVLMDIFKCMNRQEKSTESSVRSETRSEVKALALKSTGPSKSRIARFH